MLYFHWPCLIAIFQTTSCAIYPWPSLNSLTLRICFCHWPTCINIPQTPAIQSHNSKSYCHHRSLLVGNQKRQCLFLSNTWAYFKYVIYASGVASYGALGHVLPSTSNSFIFSSLWSEYDSQLSKYCIVCRISWCRCQQLTALSISTVLVTKLSVIESAAAEDHHECPMT